MNRSNRKRNCSNGDIKFTRDENNLSSFFSKRSDLFAITFVYFRSPVEIFNANVAQRQYASNVTNNVLGYETGALVRRSIHNDANDASSSVSSASASVSASLTVSTQNEFMFICSNCGLQNKLKSMPANQMLLCCSRCNCKMAATGKVQQQLTGSEVVEVVRCVQLAHASAVNGINSSMFYGNTQASFENAFAPVRTQPRVVSTPAKPALLVVVRAATPCNSNGIIGTLQTPLPFGSSSALGVGRKSFTVRPQFSISKAAASTVGLSATPTSNVTTRKRMALKRDPETSLF